jgi:hypothetical protein
LRYFPRDNYGNSADLYAIYGGIKDQYGDAVSKEVRINIQYPSDGAAVRDKPIITLKASSASADDGDNVVFSGKLLDESGKPLSGERVDVNEAHWFGLLAQPPLCSDRTDSRGNFECQWIAKYSQVDDNGGTGMIYAIFEGNERYGTSKSTEIPLRIVRN